MRVANMHQAKSQLSKLVDAALSGEEVVIARNGKPAVRLIPVAEAADARTPYEKLAGIYRDRKFVEVDPDWWKPDPEIDALFNDGPIFPDEPAR